MAQASDQLADGDPIQVIMDGAIENLFYDYCSTLLFEDPEQHEATYSAARIRRMTDGYSFDLISSLAISYAYTCGAYLTAGGWAAMIKYGDITSVQVI